jgi:hypothetical protein
LPTAYTPATNLDNRLDLIDSEERNDSLATPFVQGNNDDISTDANKRQIYHSLRSDVIQPNIEAMPEGLSSANDSTSQVSPNETNTTKDVEVLQTPSPRFFATFSGSSHREDPFPIIGHQDWTVTGTLGADELQPDGSALYYPVGEWDVSLDFFRQFSDGAVFSERYTGPAQFDDRGAPYFVEVCITQFCTSDPPHGAGRHIDYDGTGQQFFGHISGHGLSAGTTGFRIPFNPSESGGSGHPLVGSESFSNGEASWTFTPSPCQPTQTLESSSTIPQIAQDDQCKPPITVRGNVLLHTPPDDRGDISISNLKVELCSIAAENNCPVSTFTDSAGNYELSTDKLTKDDARLQITFLNRDRNMLVTQYPNNDPAKIRIANLPFITDPITGVNIAAVDVKFENIAPYISINNQPGGLSVTTINVDQDGSMAALAGVFYYAERSMQFTKQQTPIALSYNLPLKVKINAPDDSFDPTTTSIEYTRVAGFRIGGINQDKVEESLDLLLHEF